LIGGKLDSEEGVIIRGRNGGERGGLLGKRKGVTDFSGGGANGEGEVIGTWSAPKGRVPDPRSEMPGCQWSKRRRAG